MNQDFSSVLAGFVDAARKTEIKEGGRDRVPQGEYNLALTKSEFKADTNQYGPFVEGRLHFTICDLGEYQDREVLFVYFVNTMKDGTLSFGGQDLVRMAGMLAGEPIEGNNPQLAVHIIQGATGAVIKGRIFPRKTGYQGLEPLALEASAASA